MGNELEYLIILLPIGLISLYFGYKFWKKHSILRGTPVEPITSLSAGYSEVKGKISPINDKTVTNPVTGDECVFYRKKIQKRKNSFKKRSRKWSTIKKKTKSPPFLIEDDSGGQLIVSNSEEALLKGLDNKKKIYKIGIIGDNEDVPEEIKESIRDTSILRRGLGKSGLYRVVIEQLKPNDNIIVIGDVKTRGKKDIGKEHWKNLYMTGDMGRFKWWFKNRPFMILKGQDEEKFISGYKKFGHHLTLIGFILSLIGFYMLIVVI